MRTFLLALSQSSLLEYFAADQEIEGWEETAFSWVMWAMIIAFIVAMVMLLFKLYKKKTAGNIRSRTWSARRTWFHIGLGALLVPVSAFGVWYFSRDFNNIVGFKGLGVGIFTALLLYVVFMVFVHLVSPWRNEIS